MCSRRLGKHTIVFDFTYDGPGTGKGHRRPDGGWQGCRQPQDPAHCAADHALGETFDVGVDTRSPGTTTITNLGFASPANSQN